MSKEKNRLDLGRDLFVLPEKNGEKGFEREGRNI